MKCTLDFPVSLGQTLFYANHKRNCVDKVRVDHLSVFGDGTVMIGVKDKDGDYIKPKYARDLGVTLFEDEDSANCAVLAAGGAYESN